MEERPSVFVVDDDLRVQKARGRGRGVAALGTVLAGILLASCPCAFALKPAGRAAFS